MAKVTLLIVENTKLHCDSVIKILKNDSRFETWLFEEVVLDLEGLERDEAFKKAASSIKEKLINADADEVKLVIDIGLTKAEETPGSISGHEAEIISLRCVGCLLNEENPSFDGKLKTILLSSTLTDVDQIRDTSIYKSLQGKAKEKGCFLYACSMPIDKSSNVLDGFEDYYVYLDVVDNPKVRVIKEAFIRLLTDERHNS